MNNEKYYSWLRYCVKIINKENLRKSKVNAACITTIVTMLKESEKKSYAKKRFWVDKIFLHRQLHGFYEKIFPVLQHSESRFVNYFRMTPTQLEDLLCIVGHRLYKRTFLREPVSPGERLCITLRYSASGDMMSSLQYQYLRGLTTVSNIIQETCTAIWDCLHSLVLPSELKEPDWLRIAKDFEEIWNFKNCIGAIDGKHVVIQYPNNAGSSFYNYKGSHSIVLLAVCDANYLFTFVNIGAFGRGSDSTVFRNSIFGRKFYSNHMNLPNWTPISCGGQDLPYCLVGDEGFPLTNFLLRPYPGKSLNPEREIYNYRLSRARRTIENTFGILASQWRIFRKPIISSVNTAEKVVQAAVCLHNWIRKNDLGSDKYVPPAMVDKYSDDGLISRQWQELTSHWSFQDLTKVETNTSSRSAISIRDDFCAYFNSEGAVPWQYDCYH